jgi:hypothetical protein
MFDQVINEMAGQTVMLHQDRCTKNYYMHRDTRTNLWSRIPWYISAIIIMMNVLLPVQQNSFTHQRVLLVLTDRGMLARSNQGR